MIGALLVLSSLLATPLGASAAPAPAAATNAVPAATAAPAVGAKNPPPAPAPPTEPEEPAIPPPPPPPPPVPSGPRRYGDAGTAEIAIGLGYSSGAGFLGAGGFRYFVVNAVAPGVEATYVSGGTVFSSFGMAMGSLRLVPVRADGFALVLTGRAGRVFLSDHTDGWGAGGGIGVLVFLGPNVGLELGYEVLRLLPASFCADLDTCFIQRPVVGLRVMF